MAKAKKSFVKKEETVALLQPKKKNRFRLGKKSLLVLSILVLALAVITPLLYFQYQNISKTPQNKQQILDEEKKTLINRVGQLIILPIGEEPRTATVSDENALKGNLFFGEAKNGDKALVYSKAGKAIFYRENINKVVDFAFFDANSNSESQSSSSAQILEPASAVVLNGTLTSGLAKNAQGKLATSLPNISVSKVGDTAARNYESTIVVDISGNKKVQAEEVARLLGGRVEVAIPEGEVSQTTDMLIIIGNNYVE